MQLEAKQCNVMVNEIEMWKMIEMDQTGKFSVTLNQGAKNLMVMCEIDEKFTLPAAIKYFTEGKLIKAYLS